MLTHVVLMQLRADAPEADIADLDDKLRDLAARLVGPDSYTLGTNATEEPFAQGYDFGFVIRFHDRQALAAYHGHPDHQPISDAVQSLSTTFLVFDFAG